MSVSLVVTNPLVLAGGFLSQAMPHPSCNKSTLLAEAPSIVSGYLFPNLQETVVRVVLCLHYMMTAHHALLVTCLFVCGMSTIKASEFNCTNFNQTICKLDAKPFCLTNGTIVTGSCDAQTAVCSHHQQIDPTFTNCSSSQIDCTNYNPQIPICTKDYKPYCLSNGTVVKGTCSAKQAVCSEKQQINSTFAACGFDCTTFDKKQCTKDAIRFCLKSGIVLSGTCVAKQAVCEEKKALDITFTACMFNCSQFNPEVCTRDAIPFCLSNGTKVIGKCAAQNAVCVQNKAIDITFTACRGFDCGDYNEGLCQKDSIPFCLTNGTLLSGSCDAKRAVCVDGQEINKSKEACPKGTITNEACTNTAFPLVILTFITSLIFTPLIV